MKTTRDIHMIDTRKIAKRIIVRSDNRKWPIPCRLALVCILFASIGFSRASYAQGGPRGCTGPFSRPSPIFPDICELLPQVCDDEDDLPSSTFGNALIKVSKAGRRVESGRQSPGNATKSIRAAASNAFITLGAPRQQRIAAARILFVALPGD